MSYEPDEPTSLQNLSDRAQDIRQRAQEKAQDAYQVSRQYVKENPFPVILGAFIVGAAVGVLLTQKEREQKDTLQAARDLLDTAYNDLTDKLPRLKRQCASAQHDLVERAQDLAQDFGKKIKWW